MLDLLLNHGPEPCLCKSLNKNLWKKYLNFTKNHTKDNSHPLDNTTARPMLDKSHNKPLCMNTLLEPKDIKQNILSILKQNARDTPEKSSPRHTDEQSELRQLQQQLAQEQQRNAELSAELERLKAQLTTTPDREKEERIPPARRTPWCDWKDDPKNKGRSPLECLEEVWGDLIDQGRLYRFDLGGKDGLDPALMRAALNYCNYHKIKDHAYLPPTKQTYTARLAQGADEAQHKALEALRRRKQA